MTRRRPVERASVKRSARELVEAPDDDERACRAALGEIRAEHVALEVARLPPAIDRGAVWRAITRGVEHRAGWALLGPKWCRRRDARLDAVRRAIEGLKDELRRSPWPGAVELAATWTAGLERELRRLTESEALDDGRRTVPFMRLSRAGLGWLPAGSGGRPAATWRAETAKALRALGVPATATEDFLDAAGLMGKSPMRKPKPKR